MLHTFWTMGLRHDDYSWVMMNTKYKFMNIHESWWIFRSNYKFNSFCCDEIFTSNKYIDTMIHDGWIRNIHNIIQHIEHVNLISKERLVSQTLTMIWRLNLATYLLHKLSTSMQQWRLKICTTSFIIVLSWHCNLRPVHIESLRKR